MTDDKPTFEGWAVVELFGHNQIAGYVSEVSVFGTAMMRVDVPEAGGNSGYTKLFGGAAIYAVTPTSEEVAKVAARRLDVRPVSEWIVPTAAPKMLPRDIPEALDDEGEDDGHPFF